MKNELLYLFKNASRKIYTRKDLSGYFNVSDRKVRKVISELRKEGHPIVATSKFNGYYYFIPGKEWCREEDLEIMHRETMSRIIELLKILKPIQSLMHGESFLRKQLSLLLYLY